MPAFSFEKISAPAKMPSAMLPAGPTVTKRGVIVTLLDRLTETRLQREVRELQKAERDIGFTEGDVTPSRTRT